MATIFEGIASFTRAITGNELPIAAILAAIFSTAITRILLCFMRVRGAVRIAEIGIDRARVVVEQTQVLCACPLPDQTRGILIDNMIESVAREPDLSKMIEGGPSPIGQLLRRVGETLGGKGATT